MKILVFDNYDSFTYNLVHLIKKVVNDRVDVFRNDEITLKKVGEYDKIILSPGPGIPKEAGLLLPLIKEYAATKSILGVCLGHQAIGESFGGSISNLTTVYHGVASPMKVIKREDKKDKNQSLSTRISQDLFEGLPDVFPAGRYHSWIVNDEDLPADLEVTVRDDNGYIMAMHHTKYDVQGVQFHPESVLTPDGEMIMRNWLRQ